MQSGVLLAEKKRNPGVGYFASISQQQQQQQPYQHSTLPQQQTQFHPSAYPTQSSPAPSPSRSRGSISRPESLDDPQSPVSPLSRHGSISSYSLSEHESRSINGRRGSIDSDRSGITEGPSLREREREDEAINFEYLRNVLLEFLEKPAMRPQLISVIGIILKFSPAESRRLSAKVGL